MADQLTLPKMRRRRQPTPTGEDLKRRGVERALKNEHARWRRRALECILDLAAARTFFDADDIQAAVQLAGHGQPHHPNVWGGLARTAMLMGVMTPTGRWARSRRSNAHSRMIPMYRSVQK